MEQNFFTKTQELREEIGNSLINYLEKVENDKIKDILMQRQTTSRYIKGITSYYLHKGLGGKFSHKELINFAAAVEIYSTSMVLIDNLIDKHFQRDGKTTYLKEYGPEMTALGSLYAANVGLLKLSRYLQNFFEVTEFEGHDAVGKAITSAVSMDIEHPKKPNQILENIIRVNGITLGFPLGLVASTATEDKMTIFEIMRYGTDTGTAFGLYEEIRDFVGQHGRGKASEMRAGRTPYFLAELDSEDSTFNSQDYVGHDITDPEHEKLLNLLKETNALKKTKSLIKNHLNYGKEIIKKNLRDAEFKKLDSLRITIEDSLDQLV